MQGAEGGHICRALLPDVFLQEVVEVSEPSRCTYQARPCLISSSCAVRLRLLGLSEALVPHAGACLEEAEASGAALRHPKARGARGRRGRRQKKQNHRCQDEL